MPLPASATSGNADADARLRKIVSAIESAVSFASGEAAERDDLKTQADQLKSKGQNKREELMTQLAELASLDDWTETEVQAASALAASNYSSTHNSKLPTSIATFVSEIKYAMHPAVRDDVGRILTSCRDAWTAEKTAREINKDAPQPIAKAFAREYHFKVKVMREQIAGRRYMTQDELVAFAKANDPDHDPEKVHKRLGKIISDLTQFNQDFGIDDIASCVGFLNEISKDELAKARRRKLGLPAVEGEDTTTEVSAPTSTQIDTPKGAKPAAKPTKPVVVPPTHAPVEDNAGVFDVDALLNNPELVAA